MYGTILSLAVSASRQARCDPGRERMTRIMRAHLILNEAREIRDTSLQSITNFVVDLRKDSWRRRRVAVTGCTTMFHGVGKRMTMIIVKTHVLLVGNIITVGAQWLR